jgi:hypothetical protein
MQDVQRDDHKWPDECQREERNFLHELKANNSLEDDGPRYGRQHKHKAGVHSLPIINRRGVAPRSQCDGRRNRKDHAAKQDIQRFSFHGSTLIDWFENIFCLEQNAFHASSTVHFSLTQWEAG